MARLAVYLWLLAAAIPAPFSVYVTSSWAVRAKEEICDADADFRLRSEDYPAAIDLHLKVLRAHYDNALAHYHLGFAYGMTGRSTDELSEYRAAARLGLRQWDLFLNLGLAYLGQDDYPKAIGALHTAVLLGPAHPEAHFNLAIAYEGDHQLHEALQEIEVALRLAPSDPDEHNTKAIICSELGDVACARDEWVRLVQVAPYYMPAQINLAILRCHISSPALPSSALNRQ
jgi:Flp pilus assembly protein TadD